MRYWDTSALVPLVVDQGPFSALRALSQTDPDVWTWWGSEVECASALSRLEREQDRATRGQPFARLAKLAADWWFIPPDAELKAAAIRLLRAHPLRAADALQLAAALTAAAGAPGELAFVTLDNQLGRVASMEGFPVVAPGGKLS